MTDPRYDPRYQRGWSGTPPADPVPPSPVRPAPARPPVDESPAPAPAPAPAQAQAEQAEQAEAPAEPEPDETPARNPFLLSLAILGAVLVVAAAGMLWQLTSPVSSSDPADWIGPQIESEVAPWLLLAGILCFIAAISVRAVRRR